ncbi:MFS transporter, partial [Bacillus vallismortis]|nr:MFS transporter [Bacillus vallismortis]
PIGCVSMLSSMVNLATFVFGGIIAASLRGFLVDVTGSFTLSFLVAGFVLVLGLVFYVFVLGDVKRIKLA